jgi:hypothetical protein
MFAAVFFLFRFFRPQASLNSYPGFPVSASDVRSIPAADFTFIYRTLFDTDREIIPGPFSTMSLSPFCYCSGIRNAL